MLLVGFIKVDNKMPEDSYIPLSRDIVDNNVKIAGKVLLEKMMVHDNPDSLKRLLIEKQFGQIYLFPKTWDTFKRLATPFNLLVAYLNPNIVIRIKREKFKYKNPFIPEFGKYLEFLLEHGIYNFHKYDPVITKVEHQVINTLGSPTFSFKLSCGIIYGDLYIPFKEDNKGKLIDHLITTASSYKLSINKASMALKIHFGWYETNNDTFVSEGELATLKLPYSIQDIMNETSYYVPVQNILTGYITYGQKSLASEITLITKKYADIKIQTRNK